VVGPDEQGNKTVIEKYLDENDKKVEVRLCSRLGLYTHKKKKNRSPV